MRALQILGRRRVGRRRRIRAGLGGRGRRVAIRWPLWRQTRRHLPAKSGHEGDPASWPPVHRRRVRPCMAKDTEKLIRQLSLISYLMAERRPVTASEIRRDVEGYSGMNEDAFARR